MKLCSNSKYLKKIGEKMIKGITLNVNNESKKANFPDSDNIIIKSQYSNEIFMTMENLLTCDLTGNSEKVDKSIYNIDYKPVKDAHLFLQDGEIYISNGAIKSNGTIPQFHVIRYVKQSIFRSIQTSNNLRAKNVETDTRVYSNIFDYKTWLRISATVNQLIGGKFVDISPNKITFTQDYGDWSEMSAKFAYMLISECYLTQKDGKRILLMNNINDILPINQALKLFEVVKGIKGHSVIFSNLGLSFNDAISKNIKVVSI